MFENVNANEHRNDAYTHGSPLPQERNSFLHRLCGGDVVIEENIGKLTKEVFQQSRQPPTLVHHTEGLCCEMEIPIFLQLRFQPQSPNT